MYEVYIHYIIMLDACDACLMHAGCMRCMLDSCGHAGCKDTLVNISLHMLVSQSVYIGGRIPVINSSYITGHGAHIQSFGGNNSDLVNVQQLAAK